MDRFCKTEKCWMGPIEELGYMLEVFFFERLNVSGTCIKACDINEVLCDV